MNDVLTTVVGSDDVCGGSVRLGDEAFKMYKYSLSVQHVNDMLSLKQRGLLVERSHFQGRQVMETCTNRNERNYRWMAEGALHAAIVTFLPMAALGAGGVLPEGRRVGLWGYGLVVFSCVVLVANGRIAMENKMWTAVFAVVFVLSLVVYVVVWFFFSEM